MAGMNPMCARVSPLDRLTVPVATMTHVNQAHWMYERLARTIRQFEEGLDPEHEVGAKLVSFGPDVVFHIDDIGYWGPDMIVFHGCDARGHRVQLLQHVSQLNVLLVALEKTQDEARRIGLRLTSGLDEGAASPG